MSAFGGKADVIHSPAEGPLLAISGHSSLTDGVAAEAVWFGAAAVCHGRYIVFQLAEVAIPLPLFAKFLQLIAAL